MTWVIVLLGIIAGLMVFISMELSAAMNRAAQQREGIFQKLEQMRGQLGEIDTRLLMFEMSLNRPDDELSGDTSIPWPDETKPAE